MVQFNDKARDRISGWEGVATARIEFSNGCVRWELSGTDKDGMPKTFVFDEQDVEIVQIAESTREPARTGGRSGYDGVTVH